MNILRELQSLMVAAVSASHRDKGRKKARQQIRLFFQFLGITAMAAALYFGINTRTFLDTAARAEGTVVDLQPSRDSRPGSPHSQEITGYQPVVVFVTPKGQTIRFVSSFSTQPSLYERGEKVEVVYPAHNPHDARINGFFSLWGGALILGSVGTLFFLAGFALGYFTRLKARRDEGLRKHGTPLKTEFQQVTQASSVKIDGIRPYQVFTQWKHPLTAETRVFRSDYLLFDPTPHLKTPNITVFVDKNDPEKYLVDLPFATEPDH